VKTNILLVEPNYPIRYPNLALMKISAKHKKLGDNVRYVKGEHYFLEKIPHIIYISTMFTYYANETINCINFYKHNFRDAKIEVGGIFATLMPDYIIKKTNIVPKLGCFNDLDETIPDYSLIIDMIKFSSYVKKWEDFSILFSTRGCPRNCDFCAVKTLEPSTYIIKNWKQLIDLNKQYVMFQDNNLTAMPFKHFKDVMFFIINNNLKSCFNNGFDCRILNNEQMLLLSKVKWYPGGLRLAFDNMSEDKYIQRTIKKLLDLGIPKSAFLVFCLYNFKDDLKEAMYRHSEIWKLGVRPYPQIYWPLTHLNKKDNYVSEKWTLPLIREFRQYWILGGNYKYKTFDQFLIEKGKKLEELLIK